MSALCKEIKKRILWFEVNTVHGKSSNNNLFSGNLVIFILRSEKFNWRWKIISLMESDIKQKNNHKWPTIKARPTFIIYFHTLAYFYINSNISLLTILFVLNFLYFFSFIQPHSPKKKVMKGQGSNGEQVELIKVTKQQTETGRKKSLIIDGSANTHKLLTAKSLS